MNLEKLFGSKTKVDIIKYLLFRRQGVSMRALEAELGRTFPAIKKQVDSLEEAGILLVNKEGNGFSIAMKKELFPLFKTFFFDSLKVSLEMFFTENAEVISQYFWGKKFGIGLEMDLIVVYHPGNGEALTKIKSQISEIFSTYFIENGSIVYMPFDEWQKRYRLSDRFVLQVMRFYPNIKV
ncbi:winged helix-turn-helix transcriptional regulator [bacterium]|nr:winged helix-turn-helix transcriptional regulator [bacterium]